MSNLTAVLYKTGDLRLENRPIPEPKDDEVLLQMHTVGICGSDVHYWVHGRIGDFVLREPMIMGHEASGIVKKCGKNVTNLKPGDRVAIEPGVPCRRCSYCKNGRYNLCPDMKFCATPPVHGNLSQYYTHPADFCFKLPDHVSCEEGTLLEPLSVGVHACRRAGVAIGSTVLVCGAGPIGLVTVMAAKAMGAEKICITDINADRLKMAKEVGADYTVQVGSASEEEVLKKIEELLGDKADITVECCGFEASTRLGILATKAGGVVQLVGTSTPEIKVPLVSASTREIDIRGVFRYTNCYPLALSLIATGKVDAKKLITHRFKLNETLQAYETSKKGLGIKVMIHCGAPGN